MKLNKLRNRKGAAIELAIFTMLTVFGMCMILMVVSELTVLGNNKAIKNEMNRRRLSQIGDVYYMGHHSGVPFKADNYRDEYNPVEYSVPATGGSLLVVCDLDNNLPQMAVEVTADGTDCQIVFWSYSMSLIQTRYRLDNVEMVAEYASD